MSHVIAFLISALLLHTDTMANPSGVCAPVVWGQAGDGTEVEWNALLALGWRGRADDGTDDALYAPGCW